jgi:membrane-associated phospholipid phosphatase
MQFIRWFYPFFFFLPIYKQIGCINRLWINFEWDAIFRNADQMFFGFQPASMWSKVWPQAWVSELFHFAYFTYYFQFAGLALILYYRKKRELEFHRFMAGIGMAFYVCNFAFLFFPALGPSSLGNHVQGMVQSHPPEMPGYVFTAIMKWIYQWEIPGGYFPSAHVALTTVTMLAAWRHKLERMVLWPLGLLLIASTVYCGYHYAVDVCGGLGVGLLAYMAVCLWIGRFERDLNGLGN